jgi:heme exporter protein B
MNPGTVFVAQLRRDLTVALRSADEIGNPLVFFFLVVMLFALGVGADRELLEAVAPGVIWVIALLASLLSLDVFFRRDFEDGSLEQLVLLGEPAYMAVLGKMTALWLVSGVPITLLAPLAALTLSIPVDSLGILVLSLALGTPALSLLGGVGAALTVGLRRGGILLSLLVLPFYVPILIFGTAATAARMAGFDSSAQIYWLAAISVLSITVTPFAIAAALRISVEQ